MKILLSALCLLMASQVYGVSIASLNVEWYGSGGVITGTIEDEYRNERLNDFLKNEVPSTDIFVFQEITAPKEFSALLPKHDCFTYEKPAGRHQHILMCAKKGMLVSWTVNEGVKIGRSNLRPALVGVFKNKKGIEFKVIGLHLKAGNKGTNKRIEQLTALKEDVKQDMPTIVIGDFNTYEISRTNKPKSDVEYFSEILQKDSLEEVPFAADFTFLGRYRRKFDRAWSKKVKNLRTKVYGPCSEESVGAPYDSMTFYERFISDHCVLRLTGQFE